MRFADLRAALNFRPDLGPAPRAVWWAIAAHADANGEAWPSLPVLADLAGMSVRSVTAALRHLEGAGLLEITRVKHQNNRYRIVTSHDQTVLRLPMLDPGSIGKRLPMASADGFRWHRQRSSGSIGKSVDVSAGHSVTEVDKEDDKEVGAGPPKRAHPDHPAGGNSEPQVATFLRGTGWVRPPAADEGDQADDPTARLRDTRDAIRAARARHDHNPEQQP